LGGPFLFSDAKHCQQHHTMSGPPNNVIQLRKAKAERTTKRAEGKTLCSSGFHKWQVVKQSQFDVKLGKLVTLEQCHRCGSKRTRGI